MGDLATSLVRRGRWTPAEAAAIAASTPALARDLAHNPNVVLDEDLWLKLYSARPKVDKDTASALASRRLSQTQLDAMFDIETRLGPWTALVLHNVLTPEDQARLVAAGHARGTVADVLSEAPWFDPALGKDLALAAGGTVRWTFLTLSEPDTLSDIEALEWAETLPDWAQGRIAKAHATQVDRLVEHRPHLAEPLSRPEIPEMFRRRLAGTRRVTDEAVQHRLAGLDGSLDFESFTTDDFKRHTWLLMKLIFNPVVHRSTVEGVVELAELHPLLGELAYKGNQRLRGFVERPTVTVDYSEVAEENIVAWLINRSVPSTSYDRDFEGRCWDLAAVAHNPNVPEDRVAQILKAIRGPMAAELGDRSVEAEAALLERHPTFGPATLVDDDVDDVEEFSPRYDGDEERAVAWDPPAAHVGDLSVRGYNSESASRYLAERFSGHDFGQCWQICTSLIEDFEGTFAELTELVCLMASN